MIKILLAAVLFFSAVINSYRFASVASSTLLLDETGLSGATGAYSLRKLRSAYAGSAIRVRRSSDNAEQDIGFSGNDLNTSAILSFVGAGNGYVATWYDQSGNARNFTQPTAGSQSEIALSGAIVTGSNGKPAMNLGSFTSAFNLDAVINNNAYTVWVAWLAGSITTTGTPYQNSGLYSETAGYSTMALHQTSGVAIYNYDGSDDWVYTAASAGSWYLSEARHESGTIFISVDGGSDASIASGNTSVMTGTMTVGKGFTGVGLNSGSQMQELVFYDAALSSGTRTLGRTNINAYFGLF